MWRGWQKRNQFAERFENREWLERRHLDRENQSPANVSKKGFDKRDRESVIEKSEATQPMAENKAMAR
jgi:hypothetical protein